MIVGILLAAGAGSRFGGGKLLAPLPDGTPIGVRSARILRAAVDRTLAVVRPGDGELARLLEREGVEVLAYSGAGEGMGASLAFGVAASADAAGWLVALADMPFVRPGTAAAVASLLRGGALVAAPAFQGRRGHPVGFSSELMGELLALAEDRGARQILEKFAEEVRLVEGDDVGILLDIDDLSDIQRSLSAIDKKLSQ